MEKKNITTIIYDIKDEYAKKFHEKIPAGSDMEKIIIEAARKVKQGAELEWYFDEITGLKKLKISFPPKRVYVPYKKKYIAPKK